MSDKDCLFCKIISREVPAEIVYEDGDLLAFLDINPVNPGHTLVVPKTHAENMLDTDDETLAKLAVACKKIAEAMLKALDYRDFNIGINNGPAAGQVIFHTHWHVMPRSEDDGHEHWKGSPYKEGEITEVAEKIRAEITI